MEDVEVRVERKAVKHSYVILSLISDSHFFNAKPGQFLMVKTPSPETLLRRPFSVFNRESKIVEILFQICGKGTLSLSKVKEGENLRVLGPLGNGFQFERSGYYLLVGGGRGIAPLFFLSKIFLKEKIKFKVLYGGKSVSDLAALDYFKKEKIEPVLTTEDGSAGIKGLVTAPLPNILISEKISMIYACGPGGMMKEVFHIAKKFSIPTQFSLEERMACGFGACWGCVARVKVEGKEEWVKICKEGPVFNGEEIVW